MKIYFERTGGFAGLRFCLNLDTESLPEDQAKTLSDLIHKGNVFNLSLSHKSRVCRQAGGFAPDSFIYTLRLENGQKEHTLSFSTATAPESLQPLIEWLTHEAKKQ